MQFLEDGVQTVIHFSAVCQSFSLVWGRFRNEPNTYADVTETDVKL